MVRNGQRLRARGELSKIRVRRGLSQREAAHMLGITGSALSQIENGWSQPDLRRARDMATLYRVPVGRIVEAVEAVRKRVA